MCQLGASDQVNSIEKFSLALLNTCIVLPVEEEIFMSFVWWKLGCLEVVAS